MRRWPAGKMAHHSKTSASAPPACGNILPASPPPKISPRPTITPATIAAARAAILTEARPIDDIRSTAKYRATVAANLLEEFLRTLLAMCLRLSRPLTKYLSAPAPNPPPYPHPAPRSPVPHIAPSANNSRAPASPFNPSSRKNLLREKSRNSLLPAYAKPSPQPATSTATDASPSPPADRKSSAPHPRVLRCKSQGPHAKPDRRRHPFLPLVVDHHDHVPKHAVRQNVRVLRAQRQPPPADIQPHAPLAPLAPADSLRPTDQLLRLTQPLEAPPPTLRQQHRQAISSAHCT